MNIIIKDNEEEEKINEDIGIGTEEKKEAIEKPDILYRAFTVNPDDLSSEISKNVLIPGNVNKEDPTKINDGNELGVYMSTNLSMIETAYATTPLDLNIKCPTYNNGSCMTNKISLPQCGIIVEVDTNKLSIRKPQIASYLEPVYNNGFEGDEWIADNVPSDQYKIIRLILSSHANDSREYIVNVEDKEGGLEEAIEKIKTEFNKRKEEANRYKSFLEGLEEKKRLNSFFLKNEWERLQNQNDNSIESIEKIEKSFLSPENKIDLMLLSLNKKRAVFLGDFDIAESEEHREKLIKEFSEELNSIKLLLDNINFPYEITRKIEDDNNIIGFSLVIGRNQDDLNEIIIAEKNKDDRVIGLLLGYPKTAIEAYRTKDALDINTEIPKEEYDALRKEGMLPFLNFSPSKSHWKEELDWARNNKKIIEEKSPSIFNEAVEDSEKLINSNAKDRK